MRTVRFAGSLAWRTVLNVLPENSLDGTPSNKAQCAKSKKKGYYEAFRLLLENLVKADRLAIGHPFTELAAVRCRLKYECHGRETSGNFEKQNTEMKRRW